MASLFHRNDPVDPVDPALPPGDGAAYEKGRLDERRRVDRDGAGTSPARADARADRAYAAGRRDARRRRGSPLLTLLLLIVVAIGAILIYLAIQNGSFSKGGAVIDQNIVAAKDNATAPVRGAADKVGNALENAGTNLKQKAGNGGP